MRGRVGTRGADMVIDKDKPGRSDGGRICAEGEERESEDRTYRHVSLPLF
jgi:hypothetical protein